MVLIYSKSTGPNSNPPYIGWIRVTEEWADAFLKLEEQTVGDDNLVHTLVIHEHLNWYVYVQGRKFISGLPIKHASLTNTSVDNIRKILLTSVFYVVVTMMKLYSANNIYRKGIIINVSGM